MRKQETNDEKNELIELIKLIDGNFEIKRDIIIWKNVACLILIIIMFSFLFFLMALVTWGLSPFLGELPIESKVANLIALAALSVAFGSIGISSPDIPLKRKMTYQEHVDINYDKLKIKVKEGQRLFLKALIMMKCKQPDFNLKDIYDMDNSLFKEKRLLNKLYE